MTKAIDPKPFNDLQTLWDAQPVAFDHLNPKEISMSVQQSYREEQKRLLGLNVQEVLPSVGLFAWFGWKGLTGSENQWAFLVAAVLCLFVGLFLVVSSLRQHRAEQHFGDSTSAELERSKSQLEHRAWLLRNVAWWYLLPLVAAIGVVFASTSGGMPVGLRVAYGLVVLAGAGWIYRKNRTVSREQYEPKVQRLNQLIADLNN